MQLVGKTKSQLIGKRYKELFEPVDWYWLEIYNEIARKGISINYKNKKSTNGKYYEIFAWEIQKNLIAVIFADITERKLKELQFLKDKENATVDFIETTSDFHKKMLPYADKSNLIAGILFYEETMKLLHEYNEVIE